MYPETDVLPVVVSPAYVACLGIPELLTAKEERFVREMELDPALAHQLAYSTQVGLFEDVVGAGVRPNLAARTILATLRELSRDGVAVEAVGDDDVLAVLLEVENGSVAKEAIPDIFRAVAGGMDVRAAVESVAPGISDEELTNIIRAILEERVDFVKEQGMRSVGPVMGVVMKEVRGRADGKKISDLLKKEVQGML